MEYAQNLILDINPQTGLTTNSKNVIKLLSKTVPGRIVWLKLKFIKNYSRKLTFI